MLNLRCLVDFLVKMLNKLERKRDLEFWGVFWNKDK